MTTLSSPFSGESAKAGRARCGGARASTTSLASRPCRRSETSRCCRKLPYVTSRPCVLFRSPRVPNGDLRQFDVLPPPPDEERRGVAEAAPSRSSPRPRPEETGRGVAPLGIRPHAADPRFSPPSTRACADANDARRAGGGPRPSRERTPRRRRLRLYVLWMCRSRWGPSELPMCVDRERAFRTVQDLHAKHMYTLRDKPLSKPGAFFAICTSAPAAWSTASTLPTPRALS
jgi:hypothetical protein